MNEAIENIIVALPPHKQLLFGTCCLKRIENHLYKFLEDRSEKSASIAVSAQTDVLFLGCLLNNFASIGTMFTEEEQTFIDSLIPDTDVDGSKGAVFAQNAAIALAYCIRFAKEHNSDFINYCGLKLFETVDVMGFDTKEKGQSDRLVWQEIAVQQKIVKLVDAMSDNFDEADLEALKETIRLLAVG